MRRTQSTGANTSAKATAVRLELASASISRKGAERDQNGDAVLADPRHRLFAIADGVGVSTGAAKASETAIMCVHRFLASQLAGLPCEGAAPAIRRAFEEANEAILRAGSALGRSIQSTLTVALFVDGKMYVGHTGDSRAYLLKGGELRLLTNDHTVVEDLVRESLMSEESARHHPRRGMLSGCLGWNQKFRFDATRTEVAPGQAVMLCSDGVSAFVTEEDMVDCLGTHAEPRVLAQGLLKRALANGSSDDLSAIVILVKSDPVQEGTVSDRDESHLTNGDRS